MYRLPTSRTTSCLARRAFGSSGSIRRAIPGCCTAQCRRWKSNESILDSSLQKQQQELLDKEDFYSYYLHLYAPAPKKNDLAGSWLLSLNVDEIQQSLPSSLRERPLSVFSGQSIDLLTAQKCLGLILAKTTKKYSKEQLRQLYSKAKIGTHVLAWVHRNYDHLDLSSHAGVGFIKLMIHIAFPQSESERHIWNLLEMPYAPKVLFSQSDREKSVWRGVVLRALVESHAYWAEGHEAINQALRCFARSWSFNAQVEHNKALMIPKVAAGVWILKHLMYTRSSLTADVKLYDDFVATAPRWKRDPFECCANVVNLLRVHPFKPNPLPSWKFLQYCIAATPRPERVRQLLHNWHGFTFIFKTAQALDRAGHHVEARQALDWGRAEMPDRFDMSTRSRSDRAGTRLKNRSLSYQKFMTSKRTKQRQAIFESMLPKSSRGRDS